MEVKADWFPNEQVIWGLRLTPKVQSEPDSVTRVGD
jgi:hypothetical protein